MGEDKFKWNVPSGMLIAKSNLYLLIAGNESNLGSARLDSLRIESARNSTRVRHKLFFSSNSTRFKLVNNSVRLDSSNQINQKAKKLLSIKSDKFNRKVDLNLISIIIA